jgi:N-acetylglutamate synthase-like GNAT family acetyltransferase
MRAEALSRYNDVIDPSAPPPKNDALVPRSVFFIARFDGQAVGCAALRPVESEVAEVKRMYVAPTARRRGIARHMLAELERTAVEFGYRVLRLETGDRQPEAIALYESSGFRRIPAYGCHVHDPLSICFEKIAATDKTVPANKALRARAAVLDSSVAAERHNAVISGASAPPTAAPEFGSL